MSEIVKVTLPDGTQKEAARGTRVGDFVREKIGQGLAKAAYVARLDGEPVDLSRPLDRDVRLEVVTTRNPEALEVARHDAAHVMASVVQKLYPGTQVTIGPSIEEGFYYDFARETPFTPEDLERIEKATNEAIAADHPFVREEVSMADALALFERLGEELQGRDREGHRRPGGEDAHPLPARRLGRLLPRAPRAVHRPHRRGEAPLGGRGLLARRSEEPHAAAHLRDQLLQQEGARRVDHADGGGAQARPPQARARRWASSPSTPTLPGAAFWLQNGTTLYHLLGDAMRRLTRKNGYVEVKTPLLFNKKLWETSGHWGKYRENMFLVVDSETDEKLPLEDRCTQSLKPMNCPSHHLLYAMQKRSYRELPIRYHTQDVLHRNEASGTLSGLTRVRQFQQDDAHIYLAESQIVDEVRSLVRQIDVVYKAMGLSYTAKFSTRPAVKLGDDATWDRAEAALRGALEAVGLPFEVKPGEGAFYGPKIDFDVTDSIGRKWQLATIQLDYLAPERFDLAYVGRRQRRAPAGGDPPGHLRLLRALHGHPHRALRRGLPDLARAGAGPGGHRLRPLQRLGRRGGGAARRRGVPGRARPHQREARRQDPRRAARRRSPSPSWWARRRSRRRGSPRAGAAARISRPCRSTPSSSCSEGRGAAVLTTGTAPRARGEQT